MSPTNSKQTGAGNFIEDCRLILIMCRERAALTSYEMARVVCMTPQKYMRAEIDGKGLKLSHIMKAADLVGLKVSIEITPIPGSDLTPTKIPLI